MTAQLNSDVTTLSAALYRVKKQIGPERFAAAQTALHDRKSERQDSASSGKGGEAPTGVRSQAADSDDVSEILALVRAAGLEGYRP